MNEPALAPDELEVLARDLERLERVTTAWETEKRATVEAIRGTVEQLQAEAFRRLIRALREDEAARAALVRAVDDPWVRAVLTYHGILRAPAPAVSLDERLQGALARVRPALTAHGGDVRIDELSPPRAVLRLVGTCDGCAFSGTTSRDLVEVEVKKACPELSVVEVVTGGSGATGGDGLVALRTREAHDVCALDEVPAGGAVFHAVAGRSIFLSRVGDEVRAYPNACAHLGMPLDDGEIVDGTITCRYHGFRYLLDTGECTTVREVALPQLPTSIVDGRVRVDLGRAAMRGAR